MKKQLICLALASLLTSGIADAGDWFGSGKGLAPLAPPAVHDCLSYDFVDLEYIHTDFGSGYFGDGDGYGIGFSKSIGDVLFLTGSFASGGYDYDWVNHIVPVDTNRYRLGAGARVGLAECVDLVFEGGAQHLDAEYGGGYSDHDYDSWGWYMGTGIRARTGRLEWYAKVFYTANEGDYSQEYLSHHTTNYGRVDDYGWVYTPGVIYHLTDNVGLKFGMEIDEDDTSYLAGLRFHF